MKPRGIEKRGISLVGVLLLFVMVSLIVTLVGYLIVRFAKVEKQVQTFKSAKQAAESISLAIINEINTATLIVNCTPPPSDWCPVTTTCVIKLPPDIEQALKASNLNGTAYLKANCTGTSPDSRVYTILVEVNSTTGVSSRIFYIYSK